MGDGVENLEAELGQFRLHQLGEARAEEPVLMHQHDGFRRPARILVQLRQVGERGLRHHAEAGAEAEGVLEPAGDDGIGDADIDDIGQVVARRRLARGQADRRGEAADDADDALLLHALDLRRATLRRRPRIAEDHLQLGAAHGLDAAGIVDRLDRGLGADLALLPVISERAGHRLEDADLHHGRLGAQDARHGDGGTACGGAGQHGAAGEPGAACGLDLALVGHRRSPL